MRETLTVLAGLLVAALLAALIGPSFVDWTRFRPQIEERLSTALGVETRIGGPIAITLLPSPHVELSEVRIGAADTASNVQAERLAFELGLASLARGEIRIAQAAAEGAVLTLVLDAAGRPLWPARTGPGLPAQTGLDRLVLRRSALSWREPGRPPLTFAPVAAELSAASLGGPWRLEGEVEGASLRITTGAIEAGGRLRTKLFLTGAEGQLSFDGALLLPPDAGFGLDGTFSHAPGGAVAVTGQVAGGPAELVLSKLAIDLAGGAARLEGEGRYRPREAQGSLGLKARRIDGDALAASLQERAGALHALDGLPGTFALDLAVDQLALRGEDFAGLQLSGRLDRDGLTQAQGSVRVAGAEIAARGILGTEGVSGGAKLAAADARRLALALMRGGLDPALAEMVAGLGRVEGEAEGRWQDGALSLSRLRVAGSSGLKAEGSAAFAPEKLSARLAVAGLDLAALPPGSSFAGLFGARDLGLELTLTGARYRNAPPGSAGLDLRREGQRWRLSRLTVEGFGGVSVTGSGALLAEGGDIAGRIRAPRFETLAALAGPLLPDGVRAVLLRAGDGLARLDAGFRVTRAAGGATMLVLDGTAQAGRFGLEGRLDPGERWRSARLTFELAERRRLFAALGLPQPQEGGPGRLLVEADPQRLAASLSAPGLSASIEGEGAGGPRLSVQAERPGLVLPGAVARQLPDGLLDAHAVLRPGPESIGLDRLVANAGGQRLSGDLALTRDGAATGRLALERIDLAALAGWAANAPAGGGANWSTARFGPAPVLGEVDIALEAARARLWEGIEVGGLRARLRLGEEGLRLDDLVADHGGGKVAGRLSVRRDGGLAALSGRLSLQGIDLAGPTGGALTGKLSGQIDAGGSGETPARLIAGLSGAGTLNFAGAGLSRLDPAAYAKVLAETGEDASESEADRLQRRLDAALDAGSWPLGDLTVPFTLAGGLVRLQPVGFARAGMRGEASGIVDLRAMTSDVRLALRPLGPLPKGWPGDAPQIGVAWRGPLAAPRRETDVGALSNTVAARALAREIERVEAFEAEARERAFHTRRLRAERETRENERRLGEFLRAEEARRIAEEKAAEEKRRQEEARRLAEEKRAEEQRRAEERRAEEQRRAEEARRLAEERKAEEARRQEEARAARERQRAGEERLAPRPAGQGPLVLPGSPQEGYREPGEITPPSGALPATPPARDIQGVP